ncbi:MAG: transcriptional repressor [Bacteroidales bacterium]|nr:transcriptional repressor [Bacteroidales bacterium]
MKNAENYLIAHDIKPTAVRIVVWNEIAKNNTPFSLKDVEQSLPYMDRSSIFRSLKLFTEKHLLHEIDDGSGFVKYCVCHCDSSLHLGHPHFTCVECGKTFCLSETTIPLVTLPQDYKPAEVEYIIKGYCPACARKK